MREPTAFLSRSGGDLLPVWGPLLVSISITDESGETADSLKVVLDDRDGQCAYPDLGAIVEAGIGYRGNLGKQGSFEIDEVEMTGWPQKIILHGTSCSNKKATKEKQTKAYKKDEFPTLGHIIDDVAKRNKWSPKVSQKLRSLPNEYQGQAGEADTAFVSRLIKPLGGILAVKDNNLVVTSAADGKSASGKALTPIIVRGGEGGNLITEDAYTVTWRAKPQHGKAEAHTFDRKKVKRVDVDAGQGDITYRFRNPFPSQEAAKLAAESRLRIDKRSEGSATFVIEGDPAARAESPVIAVGLRSRVDGQWNAKRVEHEFDGSYRVTLQCETPGSDGDSEGKGGKDD